MSIEIVAGTDSVEFALATIDYKLLAARICRDEALKRADQAVLDCAPIAEHVALEQANAMTLAIDWRLEQRYQVMRQG